jgi:RNA polymerase sigma factor (sigma-70 family)
MARSTENTPASRPGLVDSSPVEARTVDWEAELARHGRWLRTVVIARLGESQAVDEVLQEVSLAAVRQKAPLADTAKVAPWLYRLAVRQVLLYRRAAGRRRRLVDRYTEKLRPGEQDARAVEPLDAEILLLKYTEDWSYRQIADHLGVSHSAVESRLHRARSKLRQRLEGLATQGQRQESEDQIPETKSLASPRFES